MRWVNLFGHERSPIKKAIAAFGGLLLFTLVSTTANAARLRAGFASPSLNVAMLWITQEGRLFEKNGVDVEALYLESTLAQKALIAGNIDFSMMTAINMAAPKLAGADLIMLAGFVNRSPIVWWYVRKSMRPATSKVNASAFSFRLGRKERKKVTNCSRV